MDTGDFDRLVRLINRSGTRRAALSALLGTAALAPAFGAAPAKGKRRGRGSGKRRGGGSVRAESKPVIVGPIHEEFPEEELFDCGSFTILVKSELDFTLRRFFDADGTLVKIVETVSGVDTFINSVTRKEIAAPFHNTVHIDFDPPPRRVANMGIIFKVTVPGAGAVFLDIGRIVFQAGEIVFQAGPHQFFDGDFDALCAALA